MPNGFEALLTEVSHNVLFALGQSAQGAAGRTAAAGLIQKIPKSKMFRKAKRNFQIERLRGLPEESLGSR